MRTVGIIAEYNPFHTGHEYHIRKAKEAAGADYAIVVMSPDFVQRGEPAVFDKYTRARMALLGGADLVIELPVCYAAGSAEYFAEGAVAILDALDIVDVLCFGGESDDVNLFRQTAKILLDEPAEYAQMLRRALRDGKTFPQARCEALTNYIRMNPQLDNQTADSGLETFLATPNNILGIEYCKALLKRGSRITPLPILRQGSAYNSNDFGGSFCSATALRGWIRTTEWNIPYNPNYAQRTSDYTALSAPATRQCFSDHKVISISPSIQNCERSPLSYIPQSCRELFLASADHVLTSEDFLPYLNQKLLSMDDFSSILDISSDLSDRILGSRFKCMGKSYEEIVALLKTRQITEARIRRALLHLVLDLPTETVADFRENGTVFYAHALGFRKSASPLLHALKKQTKIPFVVKPATAVKELSGLAKKMWKQDLYASHLYRSISASKYGTLFKTEYECSPVIF